MRGTQKGENLVQIKLIVVLIDTLLCLRDKRGLAGWLAVLGKCVSVKGCAPFREDVWRSEGKSSTHS